ncbi:hypothetical protein O181_044830 [Austropuccinia psidii MF-1]|uniref:Uncharacterized protein n=1 Tax=Austropuccinia psidii MF-1 TaxID=1389203 RepID=A0A9Q3DQ78_9BASI|nr:hypothetical protein [Austropuccinia psidii MF-1]
MEKRIFIRQGSNFLYPNFQRVPPEGTKSPKDLVRELYKEKKAIPKKIIEKEKPLSGAEDQKIAELENKEKESSIAQVENQGNWETPTESSPTEILETPTTLRQKKKDWLSKKARIKNILKVKNPYYQEPSKRIRLKRR